MPGCERVALQLTAGLRAAISITRCGCGTDENAGGCSLLPCIPDDNSSLQRKQIDKVTSIQSFRKACKARCLLGCSNMFAVQS